MNPISMNIGRVITILSAALLCAPSSAQTQRTGDNNARAMQQLQQLSAERTQLKAENEKLKQQVEELKKETSAATAGRAALEQRLKAAEAGAARDAASSQQNTESLEKLRAQTQELVGRFRETAQSLKEVEVDRNTLRVQLQGRERELTACVDKNAGLYLLNDEILDRLEKKGVWSSLAEKEPFTKIQRTRLENLIDEYRGRAEELRDAAARQAAAQKK